MEVRSEEREGEEWMNEESSQLTVGDAALKISLDTCALKPVDLADGRELAIIERVAADLANEFFHFMTGGSRVGHLRACR